MSAHCQKATDDMLKETVQFFFGWETFVLVDGGNHLLWLY